MKRVAFFAGPVCLGLLLSFYFSMGGFCQDSSAGKFNSGIQKTSKEDSQQHSAPKKTKKAIPLNLQHIQALQKKLELKQSGLLVPFKFSEGIKALSELLKQEGHPVVFYLHSDFFRAENPDAPDIEETTIKLPRVFRKASVAEVLRLMVQQIPTRNATFIVTRDGVHITTFERAAVPMLVQEKILGFYRERPLVEIIQEISGKIGFTYFVDEEVQEKMEQPITVTFNNSMTAESALIYLTQKVGIGVFVNEDSVFITTAKRSSKLKKKLFKRITNTMGNGFGFDTNGLVPGRLYYSIFDGERWRVHPSTNISGFDNINGPRLLG